MKNEICIIGSTDTNGYEKNNRVYHTGGGGVLLNIKRVQRTSTHFGNGGCAE